ncbi:polyhomeotic-like protein 2 [Lutzomyia longipalpis]|uniref:polyhomeotic-like protein 2 n=1 Tax=Lutzomyia longipalpis TaxID=7200 RepID=UPI0024835194|nr:polyhomeotic-like protein 2 [Lutzomyia longipalpis]XP_055682184.1 polyhomeotic-like protein 2 [Lutzomyia longipalpis]
MSSKRKQIHGRNPSRGDKDGNSQPVRVGGRIKKAKTIFDPSDNLYPRKRRMTIIKDLKDVGQPKKLLSSSDSSEQKYILFSNNGDDREDILGDERTLSFYQGWCIVCLKNTPKLITCQSCSYKAHVECLEKKTGAKSESFENNWHCQQCKFCVVCQKTTSYGILTQCTRCLNFYHNTCHRPRILSKGIQLRKWMCSQCHDKETSEMSSESAVDESESSGTETNAKIETPIKAEPKKNEMKVQPTKVSDRSSKEAKTDRTHLKSSKETEEKSLNDRISTILAPFGNEVIPDASTWTANEVYSYFSRHFPNEANVFREQEIDGTSLVLMKRDDVVSGLKLKLGPAIRIYRHVLMLQKRSSDPRLPWF